MLKIFKRELLFFPLMLLLVEVSRRLILFYYPETAMFDRGSELETFVFRLWQMVWITSAAWLLLAVVFTPGFKSLSELYTNFEKRDRDYKQKLSLQAWAFFVLCMVLLLSGRAQTENQYRQKLTDTLNAQTYVREATGNNDGVEVERYLKFVGFNKGAAWCAAYVSSNLYYIGIGKPINPVTAWAPSYANPKYIVWSQSLVKSHKAKQPKPGDIFTLFYPAQNRVGHVGFVIGSTGNYFITNEGNTGLSGTREGSGVHSLKRSKAKVYAVANYITPYLKQHAKNINITSSALRLNTFSNGHLMCAKNNGIDCFNLCRKEGQYGYKNRFDLVPRFTFESERICYKDRSGGESRYQWQNKLTGYSNRDGILQGNRFNYQRQAYGRLCMQGFGNKGKAPGTPDKAVQCYKQKQARSKIYLQGKGSPVYTERC